MGRGRWRQKLPCEWTPPPLFWVVLSTIWNPLAKKQKLKIDCNFQFLPKTEKLSHANPCTLVPADFQLYREMKHKFYFRFTFFFAAKNEIGLPFLFFIFSQPGRKRNSNSLYALRFSFL